MVCSLNILIFLQKVFDFLLKVVAKNAGAEILLYAFQIQELHLVNLFFIEIYFTIIYAGECAHKLRLDMV